ncbi:MAG TPA: hypothetical protein VMU84_21055 [Thermoanaerobaculia bacterium]|nr:hypothetical protein [Thermoanaerobaculia bacterium]
MFKYDRFNEASRKAKGQDHCASQGQVFDLRGLLANGLIHDPAGMPLSAGTAIASVERKLIYAVDENFAIHVGFDGVRGTLDAVKHETLFHNADVRAAGELEVEAGVIIGVNDVSGTYRTAGRLRADPLFADAVLTALDRIGAPIEPNERATLEQRAGRR